MRPRPCALRRPGTSVCRAMSSPLAAQSLPYHGVVWVPGAQDVLASPQRRSAAAPRMRRYLPLALLNTGLVILLPTVVVGAVVPRGSPLLIVASGASAAAVSTALAIVGAALWKRQRRSRDVVFADLLLWGWLRRCWTERRLSAARALYDSARRAGPGVSIELLTGLSRLLEARDAYTHGHGQRVARHAARIARAMRLSAVEIAKVRTAAAVHDVGKLYTPREILNNPKALTDTEYAVLKRHAAWGAAMLADVGDPEITAMVLHHHERIDGHGYPDGLAGDDIPLGARIIAVADTFDAITSNRAYRLGATQKKALDVLRAQAGSQLDGVAVAAFANDYSGRRSVAWFAVTVTALQRLLAALQTASPSIGASVGGSSSILAALGTAGLLGLSPGPPQNTLVSQHRHLTPTLTRSPRTATAAPATTYARRRALPPPPITTSTLSGHVRSHAIVHRAERTPVSTNHPASTPSTSPTGPPAGTQEPVETGRPPPPAPSPPSSQNPPSSPSPPTSPPAVAEVPPLPAPPVSLPVTIPRIPTVSLPSVQTPSAAAPTLPSAPSASLALAR
jgi:HD-GYP domain-containing protein (c-di-GMP phosphodiesterase class II)